jgi:hypothetical protein
MASESIVTSTMFRAEYPLMRRSWFAVVAYVGLSWIEVVRIAGPSSPWLRSAAITRAIRLAFDCDAASAVRPSLTTANRTRARSGSCSVVAVAWTVTVCGS